MKKAKALRHVTADLHDDVTVKVHTFDIVTRKVESPAILYTSVGLTLIDASFRYSEDLSMTHIPCTPLQTDIKGLDTVVSRSPYIQI